MGKSARYTLSRLIKGGVLDVDRVIAAIKDAPSVKSRDFAWTLTDVIEDEIVFEGIRYRYFFGKLAKYDPDALVEIVDESSRSTSKRLEPNMQKAASDFVYLPESAVFAHRHIWNEIRPNDFRNHVAEIIISFYEGFFVECSLQSIADLSLFLNKLALMDSVTDLKANVAPPNPLFGKFWANLDRYLAERRLKKLSIKESAKQGQAVPTQAPEIARRIEAGDINGGEPAQIGDAAVLMAADGYGQAEVTGTRNSQVVVVKTKDNAVAISLPADVVPADLARAVVREVVRLDTTRGLTHKR